MLCEKQGAVFIVARLVMFGKMHSQVQEYKDSLKSKAEQLVLKGFPEKIVKLNELLETPLFLNRDLSDVHQELNVPIPDPIVMNSNSSELPAAKKAKYDNSSPDGTKVMILPNGPVPCNKSLCELIHLVKPHIRQLVEDSNLVSACVRVSLVNSYNWVCYSSRCGYRS